MQSVVYGYYNEIVRHLETLLSTLQVGQPINLKPVLDLVEKVIPSSKKAFQEYLNTVKDALAPLDGKIATQKDIDFLREGLADIRKRVTAMELVEGLSGDDVVRLSDLVARKQARSALLKVGRGEQLTTQESRYLEYLKAYGLTDVSGTLTKRGEVLVRVLESR